MKNYSQGDLNSMEQRERARFVNSLSGFKSANLIGTKDLKGNENLSIVSSVFHLGANPALVGFIVRPHNTSRHTLENILETGVYTINAVCVDILHQAHQTSARYDKHQSEFKYTKLMAEYGERVDAPYVKESPLKMAVELREHQTLKLNNTELVIGEIVEVRVPARAVMPDGYIDIDGLGIVNVTGLDSYHIGKRLNRLSYAKPKQAMHPLTIEGEPSSWEAIAFIKGEQIG
ncbi:flavin reductase family protein [Vibrio mexicanus]|uniref:flavin reductase family protein n=1 Tax=Vibrio mexicanus TaxID=1004326 RepID=UPI00063C94E3|nr:flavin reductase [Vibrio mexicanus]